MSSDLEKNKIFASIIIALLVLLVGSLVADALVHPKTLQKNTYIIEGVSEPSQSAKDRPEKEPEIEDLIATASIEKGKTLARKCVQCHSFEKKGPHRIGPCLWGVFENKQACQKDYPYSKAALRQEGVWNIKELNEFLKKPSRYMPGTKMSFIGLKKPQDRANLIAYLKTLK